MPRKPSKISNRISSLEKTRVINNKRLSVLPSAIAVLGTKVAYLTEEIDRLRTNQTVLEKLLIKCMAQSPAEKS